MASITLTPADNIVAKIADMAPGDRAILTAGTYSISGNILKNKIEIQALKGVVIFGSGDLFVGQIEDFILSGKAIIKSGKISLISKKAKFECEELSTPTPVIIDSETSLINIQDVSTQLEVSGQVSFQSYTTSSIITFSAGTENLPSTFLIHYLNSGGKFQSLSYNSYLSIKIGRINSTLGEAVYLQKTIGTIDIGSCATGNLITLEDNCIVNITLKDNTPQLFMADSSNLAIISGNVFDTLLLDGDGFTLNNFTSSAPTLALDAVSPITVKIDKGVSLFSDGALISSNITLEDKQNLVIWGGIEGDITNQIDLWTEISSKTEWKGLWYNSEYQQNDMVRNGDFTYIANKITTETPSDIAIDWDLVATTTGGGSSEDNMLKSEFATGGIYGTVDDSALVNGLTVDTAVPLNAVFTDTPYNDSLVIKSTDSLATDNALVRVDGIGRSVQNSLVTLNDTGEISNLLLDSDNNTLSNIGIPQFDADTIDMMGNLSGLAFDKLTLTILEEGGLLYLDVEKEGGGDARFYIDGNTSTLDCTTSSGVGGQARVDLVAGTDVNSPMINWIYTIDTVGVASLLVSTSSTLPDGAFAWVGKIVLPDAITWATTGAYLAQRYTEAFINNNRGTQSHAREKLRAMGALYAFGVTHSLVIVPDTTLPDSVNLQTDGGTIYQLHRQTFPPFTTGPYYYGNGINIYEQFDDLNKALQTQDGTLIKNKNRFILVVWGAVNIDEGTCKLFINQPNDVYGNDSQALADVNNTADYTIPNGMRTVAFMIAKIVMEYTTNDGGTWDELGTFSLLGTPVGIRVGGSSTTLVSNEFSDAQFRVFDDLDDSRRIAFQADQLATGLTRTLTAQDKDITIAGLDDIITDHTDLTSIGNNTHAQIDAHIGDTTTNPHHVTAIQTGAEPYLDVPTVDGQHLASTIAGVRSWVNPPVSITVHNDLTGRSDADTHTIGSITGLQNALDAKEDGLGNPLVENQHLASTTTGIRSWISPPVVITDHTNLSSIGTNTHASIDTHIADGTIHFTEGSISHTNILDIGINTHPEIDTHISTSTIHFTEGSISHLNIGDIGVNTHLQIDTHIADTDIHVTSDQSDALDVANAPSSTNAIATIADLSDLGGGDMLKATYDTDNSGVVDNSELVNSLTVETAVPTDALFTDTIPTGLEYVTDDGTYWGWRPIGVDPIYHLPIGNRAFTLSVCNNALGLSGATDDFSFTTGVNTKALGKASMANGAGTTALNDGSFTMGAYNVGTSTETIVEVGIGDILGAFKNGFEVYMDGTVVAPTSTPALITARGVKTLATVEYVSSLPSGVTVHNNLTGRSDADTHPVSSITGLQTALDGKVDDSQVLTDVPAGALFTDTITPSSGDTLAIQISDGAGGFTSYPSFYYSNSQSRLTVSSIAMGTAQIGTDPANQIIVHNVSNGTLADSGVTLANLRPLVITASTTTLAYIRFYPNFQAVSSAVLNFEINIASGDISKEFFMEIAIQRNDVQSNDIQNVVLRGLRSSTLRDSYTILDWSGNINNNITYIQAQLKDLNTGGAITPNSFYGYLALNPA